ncbi:hypothetical protein BS47DRAFT_1363379 [Hydnum rufescens UP504]|uniref:Myb/SANT-like domain-containing protein n=1 Tax=Hydnum rufescens UP504 TaxID=1448309 RepID=A0A9P6AVD5_9AGAM|nr:hypothetical protein BS47DRAFT_1363379 [Hydnum rufescens UP504]
MPRTKPPVAHAPVSILATTSVSTSVSMPPPSTKAPKKRKEANAKWTPEDDQELLRVLLAEKAAGNMGDNGFKAASLQAAVDALAKTHTEGGVKDKGAVSTHITLLKKYYNTVKELKDVSGFSYDDEHGCRDMELDVWKAYIKSHKNASPFRNKGLCFYNELDDLFSGTIATGEGTYHPILQTQYKAQSETLPNAQSEMPPKIQPKMQSMGSRAPNDNGNSSEKDEEEEVFIDWAPSPTHIPEVPEQVSPIHTLKRVASVMPIDTLRHKKHASTGNAVQVMQESVSEMAEVLKASFLLEHHSHTSPEQTSAAALLSPWEKC